MSVTIERTDPDGLPRRRELTAEDLELLAAALHAAPSSEQDQGRRKMLRHWFRPVAEPDASEADS